MASLRAAAIVVTGLAIWAGSATSARPVADTTAVLWRDPGDIGEKDLFWGVGSAERKPAPPFTFIREDTSGTRPKVLVHDASNVEWSVKFPGNSPDGNEVHAEIAAGRLMWALGFFVDEHYFVA